MKKVVDYHVDDKNLVYFTPIDNVPFELIQADVTFGFDDLDLSNPTINDVDMAFKSRKSLADLMIPTDRFYSLVQESQVPMLKVLCEGKKTTATGVGFEHFAIIVSEQLSRIDDLWLIIRRLEPSHSEIMADLVESISKKYNLFIADNTLGAVIDSRQKSNFTQYLYAAN